MLFDLFPGQLPAAPLGQQLLPEPDPAPCRREQAGQEIQERTLAAAVRPQDAGAQAGLQHAVQVVQRRLAPVGEIDPLQPPERALSLLTGRHGAVVF